MKFDSTWKPKCDKGINLLYHLGGKILILILNLTYSDSKILLLGCGILLSGYYSWKIYLSSVGLFQSLFALAIRWLVLQPVKSEVFLTLIDLLSDTLRKYWQLTCIQKYNYKCFKNPFVEYIVQEYLTTKLVGYLSSFCYGKVWIKKLVVY